MDIPQATRPRLSGYIDKTMLLPWPWVSSRMQHARNYWIVTHAQNYPSARPVWGVWLEPRLLFSTGSQVARNIARDGRVQVNLESGDELVIMEGVASPLTEDDLEFWVTEYNTKYNWNMPHSIEDVFEVRPARVLAWLCDSTGQDGGALFSNTATEWCFSQPT